MKKIIAILLVLTMAFSLAACEQKVEDPNVKYADIIEDFVPNYFNVEQLGVGEVNKPQAAIWCQSNFLNMVKTASTDESVVTVTDGGKVTAVGPGRAYVIISIEPPIISEFTGPLMYEIYLYEVAGAVADEGWG